MSDHRAAARHHTLRTGIVEFDNGSGSIVSVPCTIRDVSGTGARLALNSSAWVAEEFTLIFTSGLRKGCRVAWRKERLIGSAFVDGYASVDEQSAMMTADEQARHRLGIGA
ncbi:transcriptional regulator, partial [Bradyrhizobium sp. SHOUNA76]|nr:transcriptional regulator [Bradyrhizobium sp. SHOUNA76]